ncbi:hypothetical protein DMC47_21720, partial [Nostoc sp. 3335mG]
SIAKAILPTLPSNAIILLVPCAWGGTSMVNTNSNSAPNAPQWAVGRSLYEGAVAQTNAAIAAAQAIYPNSRLHSVHFAQGNTDSLTSLAAQYDTALRAVISDFRARVTGAANVPWTMSGMAPDGPTGIDANDGKLAIDNVHRAVAASVANVTYIPGPYGVLLSDGIHYNAAGTRLLGDRQGKTAVGIQCVGFDKITRSLSEGNSGITDFTFSFVRSTLTGSPVVPITFGAGGTSPDDFAGGAYPSNLSVTFASGALTASLAIGVVGDTVGEQDESFTLTVAPPTGYVASPRAGATSLIINDDAGAPPGTNLIPLPNDFDQATIVNGTVTPDTTANPVGGALTADTYNDNSADIIHGVTVKQNSGVNVTAGQPYTSAVDVRAVAGSFIQINHSSALGATSSSMWCNFEIPVGGTPAVRTSGSNATGSVIDLGNGFFRCAVTFTPSTSGLATFTVLRVAAGNSPRNSPTAGAAGPSLVLANAQMVAGNAANAF